MANAFLARRGPMSSLGADDVRRLARLARLDVGPDESAALARDLDAIVGAFGDLAAFAADLQPPVEPPAASLREDQVHAAPASVVEAILRAAPLVDKATGAVRVPRPS